MVPLFVVVILVILVFLELLLLIFQYKKSMQENVTEDDVISLVNEGHEDGNILASEAEMIQNIFEFSDTDAKDIMTHRKSIVALDGQLTLREAVDFIIQNHFSRYPVYIDQLDNIIGILHIKDLLAYFDKDLDHMLVKDFPDIDSHVEYVPETHSINTLFAKMQAKKKHLIIVVDEYGQVSGLLSMEDILEEIVGNIEDEHDETESMIQIKDENELIMDGSTSLEEAADTLGILLSEDYETLNGYLISLLGRIPEDGSTFTLEDQHFVYEVKGVTGKVIDKVLVRRKEKDDTQHIE